MPKVSIIIPVYNARKTIRRCIESVLGQEFTDFELLLMDDGSQDGSGAILDEYQSDPRVRVIHKANSGVSDTRNKALDLARGEYIQFLDADDWATPQATKLFVRAMESSGAQMVIASFYRVEGQRTAVKSDIDTEGALSLEEFADEMARHPADFYYGVLWNKLFQRSIIEEHHLRMDVELKWCEDFIFNLEYLLHVGSVYALQVPVYYYVKTPGSLATTQGTSLVNTVQMKREVMKHYDRFYHHTFDEENYERRALEIRRFLVDFAGDGMVIPGLPGTKKLGEERVRAVQMPVRLNPFTEHYYVGRLIDRYLEDAGRQFSLSLREMQLLACLSSMPEGITRQEAADILDNSVVTTYTLLVGLAARKLVRFERGSGTEEIPGLDDAREREGARAFFGEGELADQVQRAIDHVQEDIEGLQLRGTSHGEREIIRRNHQNFMRNVRNSLS